MDVNCPRCHVSFEAGDFPSLGKKKLSCPICRTFFEVSYQATILAGDQKEQNKEAPAVHSAPIISAKMAEQPKEDADAKRREDERRNREAENARRREEEEARKREAEGARRREEEEARKREAEDARRREEEETRKREAEDAHRREEEEARKREEEEARHREEKENRKREEEKRAAEKIQATSDKQQKKSGKKGKKKGNKKSEKAPMSMEAKPDSKPKVSSKADTSPIEHDTSLKTSSSPIGGEHQEAVDSFFDSRMTMKDYHAELQDVDFTDLESKEDLSKKHVFALGVTMAIFVLVAIGVVWFITDNVSRRKKAESAVFLFEEPAVNMVEEEVEFRVVPKSLSELDEQPVAKSEQDATSPNAEEQSAPVGFNPSGKQNETEAEAAAKQAVEDAIRQQKNEQEPVDEQAPPKEKKKVAFAAAPVQPKQNQPDQAEQQKAQDAQEKARKEKEQAEARQRAEEERKRREAQAKAQAEKERKQREAAQKPKAVAVNKSQPKKENKAAASAQPQLSAAEKRQKALDHYKRGNSYVTAKNFSKAVDEYKSSLKLNPGLAQAHRGLGIAYASMGNSQAAIREYKMYLQMAPNAPDAAQVRKILGQ